MQIKHYKELDGIRALAALMVMFFHFFQNIQSNSYLISYLKKISIFGQTGVSLFFVLSGFLITRILFYTKNSKSFFFNFYVRRSLRIFPLYFLFLIIYFFILPIIESKSIPDFSQQIYSWIYLQNFASTFNWKSSSPAHFWSLAVEEHFYLFWPFLIYALDLKKIKVLIVAVVCFAFITRLILLKNGFGVFYFTFARMDELAFGALLAIFEIEGRLEKKNSKVYLISSIIILVPLSLLWSFTTGLGMDSIQLFKFTLFALFYFSLLGLIITIKDANFFKKLLKSNFLTYTGKISYGLYVYHPLCFYLLDKYLHIDSIVISLILSFVFSYFLASLSYYSYETFFIKLKSKFEY